MMKCSSFKSLWRKILQLRIITCIFCVVTLHVIITLVSSNFPQFDYPHIPEENIKNELYWETSPNLVKKSNVECKYDEILTTTKTINSWEVPKSYDDFLPSGIANGTYVPEHCNPAFSVAIVVTYRNRQKQLDVFLPYMHNFLRKQNIHYKIYIVEQQDENPWNKGMLYNIGVKNAIDDKFPCLILHDVDLLPLDDSNLYVCTKQPRHMSASIDKFRFVLPYWYLVGGALAIRSDHYLAVNGFSNKYQMWGGEDDDFFAKIDAHGLSVWRYPRRMSRYTMLAHRPEAANGGVRRVLAANARRYAAGGDGGDGYAALRHRARRVTHHRLFASVAVSL